MKIKLSMARLIGKPPINIFIFLTGKISSYIVWITLFLYAIGYNFSQIQVPNFATYTAYLCLFIGIVFTFISIFNLGNAISFGVPDEETKLKTAGIYKYSRNPMYFGFTFLTLSSILLNANIAVLALGTYSIIVYHLIIRGEEKFLIKRFGMEYEDYLKKVRRYI